jgi:hypothetical protein
VVLLRSRRLDRLPYRQRHARITVMETTMHGTEPGPVTSKNRPTTNREFLNAIFPNATTPFVLGFSGSPKHHKAWGGAALTDTTEVDYLGHNAYFTLATYAAAADGFHRREKDCTAIAGVMLDDLGTKALPLARLDACPPTYVIETSEGNFQAGYLFIEPVTDFASVKDLNQSMVDAGLCDPGAKSPSTRWGRLPFAVNGKTDPAFKCKLIEWHPECRYRVSEIMVRLELAPPQTTRKTRVKSAAVDRSTEDDVYVPRAAENDVIAALKLRGLYKQPLGGGKHDVTCFRVHEHTDQIDHGTAYFEPSDLFPVGGYKCQHGHGDAVKIGALLEFLNVTFTAAKHKPTIKLEPGNIHRIVDAAELELAATGNYYQRGGLIVTVSTDPESGAVSIKPLSLPALLRALSGCAVWMRFDGRTDDFVVSDPPARHVAVLHDSEHYPHLPALTGIARQPHLRPDGSLVRDAGFDAATGLFGVFDARQFEIPDRPTKAQAAAALQELRALLTEFEFATENDLAAALAGILTATIRPCLPTAPMFHIKAPQIASGKSYLSGIIAAFASPTAPSVAAFPTTDEECQKLLLATLLAAPGSIVFDNLTTDLIPFKSLCSALTEEHLTGRILGVSKVATVGTRALFLSSGNNVDAVKDMARRCITVALDPQVETPATRQFKGDPLAKVRADRARYVSLAMTIIRAYIVAGSPTPVKPLASYSLWSTWVRQPLLWLGMADAAECVFAQLAQDPDREILGRMLHAWRAEFGTTPSMIRQAADAATNGTELREALLEIAEERGEINRRRLGKWIASHQGRIVDGFRFERASGTTFSVRWKVATVSTVKLDAPPADETVDELCEVDV